MLALVLPATLFAALMANAAGASALKVEHAISLALAHNPDLAAVEQELNVAAGEQIRASYLSQFNPQASTGFTYRPRGGRSSSQDWRLALSQEIEIFGQRALRMRSAALGWSQSAAMMRDRLRLLIAAVKMTFIEALRARRQVELVNELEKLDARLYEAARARLSAGEIGQIDYNLAEVRYGQTSRASIEAHEHYRAQRSSLGRLLGGAAGPEPEPADNYSSKLPATDLESLIVLAMRNRPDLRAGELEIARLETEASLNRRLALPNPQIGTFFGHEDNTQHPAGVSLGFSIPLFNRRQAEAAIIQARRRQAEYRLRASGLNVEKEVRDAYNAYLSARRAVAIYQNEVLGPARESFTLLEKAFQAGKLDLLSLSVAERQAFDARLAYLDAWFNLHAAEVALQLTTGVTP
ncbi:MAG: TolC family protein [Candidatus Binataceae bacterium]